MDILIMLPSLMRKSKPLFHSQFEICKALKDSKRGLKKSEKRGRSHELVVKWVDGKFALSIGGEGEMVLR